ncbi:small, acid-soluble spore protein, alpha/beta type [Alkaliphilus oremlandii]|uniref:Small acid-soluble spore protein alpha/beta type n=1 Tax=Alkaliphilus oremlandii (strain OhILAs) TaxID=350688 RepID=A8MIG6_ALKOO|nr:small, acid-soluble spore protein, alpha/beta type [Alkaliphilus oremlandii]ABW19598.1 small acid-soluble spore protein alpha/beta type [Alkaliphilus oremlandii OhILAs]
MSKNRLAVPEARQALEQYKIEIGKEFGVTDPTALASNHTGYMVRKLVEMGEQQLLDQNK